MQCSLATGVEKQFFGVVGVAGRINEAGRA
jgi:hypothetical protein